MRRPGDHDKSSDINEWVVRTCAARPGVELTFPFRPGTAVFKTGNKMFAMVNEDDAPARLTLKCDPDHARYLIERFEEIAPGYHMNKRHWITVSLEGGVTLTLIDELISDSYDLVLASLPPSLRATIASVAPRRARTSDGTS